MAFKVYTVAHPVQRVLNKENKLWCYACRRSKHQQCAGRRRLGHGQWAVCLCSVCRVKEKRV